jgi:hypothetical protein
LRDIKREEERARYWWGRRGTRNVRRVGLESVGGGKGLDCVSLVLPTVFLSFSRLYCSLLPLNLSLSFSQLYCSLLPPECIPLRIGCSLQDEQDRLQDKY